MWRALVVVMLAALASCGGTEPDADFVGDWQLQSINGDPLPATAGVAVVHAGTLSLRADETYLRAHQLSLTGPDKPRFTAEQSGTYRTGGNGVTFTASPSVVDEGTRSGRTLSVRVVGRSYRYQR